MLCKVCECVIQINYSYHVLYCVPTIQMHHVSDRLQHRNIIQKRYIYRHKTIIHLGTIFSDAVTHLGKGTIVNNAFILCRFL
jgi:hypothetical protein